MNSVNIIGRLVRDPDVKRTEEGLTICNLRFAIDDTYSKDDRSDFINVTVFGNQGEVCDRYLQKGFMAGVSGRIHSDMYTDSEGVKRYPVKLIADRVQFLQWPERGEKNRDTAVREAAPECSEQSQDTVQEAAQEYSEQSQDTVQEAAQEYSELSQDIVQEAAQEQAAAV